MVFWVEVTGGGGLVPHTRRSRGEEMDGPSWIYTGRGAWTGSYRLPEPVTHGHVVPGAVAVMLDVHVGEVDEDPVAGIHTDQPGAVHITGASDLKRTVSRLPVLETCIGLDVVVQSLVSWGANRSGPPYTLRRGQKPRSKLHCRSGWNSTSNSWIVRVMLLPADVVMYQIHSLFSGYLLG
ncbi:hypothetical protein EYF80_028646 [Liparis tanakae]|uniref:Uncharacterized protein n=1 Tax=Liparis tanakae TaxID=230148 RepID=A0A4Z2H5K0_9TELE|nr:hypothetical protein EYF80_028646 [Liparis tanakae]